MLKCHTSTNGGSFVAKFVEPNGVDKAKISRRQKERTHGHVQENEKQMQKSMYSNECWYIKKLAIMRTYKILTHGFVSCPSFVILEPV